MAETPQASSPVIWPPIIYASAAGVSLILSMLNSWSFETLSTRSIVFSVGVIAAVLGVALLAAAGRLFASAGTPVAPNRPTKALVFDGIYKYTRNPMYLGFTVVLFAIGLIFDELWFLIAAPLAMFAVTKLAIEREEAYLERKFGAAYVAYKERVRRWI